MRLTTKQFWDARHDTCTPSTSIEANTRKGWIRQVVDNARLRQGAQVGQSYNKFAIHQLLKTHLPVRSDWSVIEIGSAPGNNLVNLHNSFGYKPYGVEYSHSGVILTLKTFREHGFNVNNVIEADLFDQNFQNKFRANFNVVYSEGFIEHFDPPYEVLNLHVNLLKPGGFLVCIIPNLLGVCYPFLRLFARDHLKVHNCKLMRKSSFISIFDQFGLDTKFCGYVGAFDIHCSSYRHEHSLRGFTAAILDRVQDILDHFMFLYYRGHFPVSRLSANLAFIGQRTL
jgi:SAM-dependent methyltransferase